MTLKEIDALFDDRQIVHGGSYDNPAAHAAEQRGRAMDAIEALFAHPRVAVVATTYFAPVISGYRLQRNPEITQEAARWLLDEHKRLFEAPSEAGGTHVYPNRNEMRTRAGVLVQAATRHTDEVPADASAEADLEKLAAFQARAAARRG